MILATTPAPTVRPPSRIAKRSPSSIAIGVISSTQTRTLSPGITLSVPSGSFTTPVTPRHHHPGARGQLPPPGDVRGPKVELRPVAVKKRRVPPALLLRQHVH